MKALKHDVEVYKISDKYLMLSLCELATDNMDSRICRIIVEPAFLDIVSFLWDFDTKFSSRIRRRNVSPYAHHPPDLLRAAEGNTTKLVVEHPTFVADLLRSLAREVPGEMQDNKYHCDKCHTGFRANFRWRTGISRGLQQAAMSLMFKCSP